MIRIYSVNNLITFYRHKLDDTLMCATIYNICLCVQVQIIVSSTSNNNNYYVAIFSLSHANCRLNFCNNCDLKWFVIG